MDSQNSPILDANLLTTEVDDILELKEAIIELYLAIKIRSTEEVSAPPTTISYSQIDLACNHHS